MTFTYKSENINGYNIEMNQEKFENTYKVVLTHHGKLIDTRTYVTKPQALRRFRDLRRQVGG